MPRNSAIETYYDVAENPVEVFLIKDDPLAEFISESYREYVQNPEHSKREFYELIKEMVE